MRYLFLNKWRRTMVKNHPIASQHEDTLFPHMAISWKFIKEMTSQTPFVTLENFNGIVVPSIPIVGKNQTTPPYTVLPTEKLSHVLGISYILIRSSLSLVED